MGDPQLERFLEVYDFMQEHNLFTENTETLRQRIEELPESAQAFVCSAYPTMERLCAAAFSMDKRPQNPTHNPPK